MKLTPEKSADKSARLRTTRKIVKRAVLSRRKSVRNPDATVEVETKRDIPESDGASQENPHLLHSTDNNKTVRAEMMLEDLASRSLQNDVH